MEWNTNMKNVLICTLLCILCVFSADTSSQTIKQKEYGRLHSLNPYVDIIKTVEIINDIDIFGSESKIILLNGEELINWHTPRENNNYVKAHNKQFNSDLFYSISSYAEDQQVYKNFVYFLDVNAMRYLPAIHLQLFDGSINTTLIVEQGTYKILMMRDEVDDFLDDGMNGRDPILLHTHNANFQWWSDDSPAPGSPHITGLPDGWQAPTVEHGYIDNISSIASPMGWIYNLPPYTTSGNNIWSITIGVNNELFTDGVVPATSIIGGIINFHPLFDFEQDSDQSRTLQAAAVNMFAHGNILHDKMWYYGFKEGDGNFQTTNFNRGGVPFDPMFIANRYSQSIFINNAFYSGTHIDGTPGAITMMRFTGVDEPKVPFTDQADRHGGFDSQIFIHEYQHGVTRRLVGPISTRHASSLNEGWSDVVSYILTTEETSNLRDRTVALGGWSLLRFRFDENYVENYYYGFRIFPMSYDMNKNPLTLADIDPNQFYVDPAIPRNENASMNSPHFVGQVWVASLWDTFVLLTEVYDFEDARDMMMETIVEGLKITPPEPSFENARDSFILADIFLTDGENRVAIWNAFARRGLGVDATVDQTIFVDNVVEDFSIPNWGDYDQNGVITSEDLLMFMNDFSSKCRRADLNWDGDFTQEDVDIFMDLYL